MREDTVFCTRQVQNRRKFALTKCKIISKRISPKEYHYPKPLIIDILGNERQEHPPSEYVCAYSPKGDARF